MEAPVSFKVKKWLILTMRTIGHTRTLGRACSYAHIAPPPPAHTHTHTHTRARARTCMYLRIKYIAPTHLQIHTPGGTHPYIRAHRSTQRHIHARTHAHTRTLTNKINTIGRTATRTHRNVSRDRTNMIVLTATRTHENLSSEWINHRSDSNSYTEKSFFWTNQCRSDSNSYTENFFFWTNQCGPTAIQTQRNLSFERIIWEVWQQFVQRGIFLLNESM